MHVSQPRLFAACFIAAVLVTACASTPTIERKPIVYSYTEPEGKKGDVTLGIIDTALAANTTPGQQLACTADFSRAFTKSLYDMMVAKGMNTRGPFAALGEMTFPDKKGSDLVITPDLNVQLTWDRTAHEVSAWDGAMDTQYTIAATGALTLNVVEPLSGERMWVKKVELPGTTRAIHVQGGGTQYITNTQNAVENACGELLLEFFKTAMPKVSQYLNAQEMAMLKQQAAELRTSKRY